MITLHLPMSDETRHIIDADAIARMKPGARIVNCARGGLVDEEALYEALAGGRLGGAYLDVFEREPYDGPLTELPNALLTPHVGSYAAEARLRMEAEAVDNLLEALAGSAP